MNDKPSPVQAPEGRMRKRILIPTILILGVIGLLICGVVRGNWTDAESRTPSSPADGVKTQLLQTSEGGKLIHAAAIVSAPPERVWKVVTDYDHFSEIFAHLSASKGVRDPDGRWHLTGEVRSIAGRWAMDAHIRHEESPTRYVASWDEPYGAWKINRGSWVVTPHGAGESLLEYRLELSVSPFPDFIVRAVLLDQLKPVMKAVANRLRRDQTPR